MTIDIICASICLMMAFLGYRSGAISQVIRIAAIIAAFLLSPVVASIIREVWAAEAEVAPPMSEAISLGVAALVIYFAVSLSGTLAIRTLRLVSKTLSSLDRLIGLVLGTVKGAVICYIIASVFLVAMVPIEKRDPEDKLHIRDGELLPFAQKHSMLLPWQFPAIRQFHQMVRFADWIKREKLESRFRENSRIGEVLQNSEIKKLLADEAIVEAAKKNFYPQTLSDERVRKYLNDKKNLKQLKAVEWDILNEEKKSAEDAKKLNREKESDVGITIIK